MKTDFASRCAQKELLDEKDIPFKDIALNMQELNVINSLLGGHRITIKGFKELAEPGKKLSVLEIGCGGGDNLRAIDRYCAQKKISVSLIGVDINKECIDFARTKNAGFNFIHSDYKNLVLEDKPDIIFSSLFCHHFTNEELQYMMLWMSRNARSGFFINDLHRHSFAYYSIKFLTSLFSKSYLVKNDAPLSVMRGFKRKEWRQILDNAGIEQYDIYWKWAFRFLIISQKTNCNE